MSKAIVWSLDDRGLGPGSHPLVVVVVTGCEGMHHPKSWQWNMNVRSVQVQLNSCVCHTSYMMCHGLNLLCDVVALGEFCVTCGGVSSFI